MKTRIGFVSNSSSSSYLIGFKGKITPNRLLKLFGVPKKSLLYGFSEAMAKEIINHIKPIRKDYAKEWEEFEMTGAIEFGKKCKERGFKMYELEFHNDNGGLSSYMYEYSNLDISCDTKDIIMFKDN